METIMMMGACGSHPAGNGGGNDNYPMPTMQEECVNHLHDVLSVFQGADSLIISSGYEKCQHGLHAMCM